MERSVYGQTEVEEGWRIRVRAVGKVGGMAVFFSGYEGGRGERHEGGER